MPTGITDLRFCGSQPGTTRSQWRRNEFESGEHRSRAKVGAPIRHKAPGKIFFGRAPPLFGSKSTISHFGERFCDGQYSLVSFLFAVLLLMVPPCPVICKSAGGGSTWPPPHAPRSWHHWTKLQDNKWTWGQCVAWCACLLPQPMLVPIIPLGDRRHMCMRGKPEAILDSTRAGNKPATSNHKSNALTTMLPSHPQLYFCNCSKICSD